MGRSMLLCALMLAAVGCGEDLAADAGLPPVDRGIDVGLDVGPEPGADAGRDALADASDVITDASDAITDASDAITDASDAITDAPDAIADTSDAMPDASEVIPDAMPDASEAIDALPDGPPPAPLLIVLEAPADGALFAASPVAVSGRVGLPIDALTVAGLPVEPGPDGRFALDAPLVEGENAIVARAARGEAQVEARITVVLDTTPPALTIEAPAPETRLAADRVAVEGAADDAARVTVNGAPAAVAGGRYAVTVPLVPGENTLVVRGADRAGNEAEAEVTVARDTTAPVVRIEAPADGAVLTADAVRVQGTVDDGIATLNGEPLAVVDGRFDIERPLAEGHNRFTVAAVDDVGNRGVDTVVVARDTTAPALTVDQPADGALLAAGSARFAGTVDDRAATLTVGGVEAPISPAGLWALEVALVEGANAVEVAAVDAVGNRRALTVRVTRDTTPPPLTVDTPEEDAVVAADTVELRGTTAPDAAVTVGGEPVAVGPDGVFTVELPVVRGLNAAVVVATDAAGNRARIERRFAGDRDGPGLRVLAPEPGALTSEAAIDVRGTVLDGGATVRVNGAPAAVVDGAFEARVALAEGANTIAVEARDAAGNLERVEVPVTRDSTPPALVVEAPVEGAVVAAPAVAIRGTVEAGAALSVTVNGQAVAPGVDGGAFSAAGALLPGRNSVVVEAVDAAGNRARIERAVTFDDQPPGLWIDSPDDGAVVAEATVRVIGRTGSPAVAVGGIAADVGPDGRFAVDVPLDPGANLLAAVSGRRAVAVTVFRDVEAPRFTVISPAGPYEHRQLDVLGRAVDGPVDGPVQVWVDGVAAAVSGDGFALRDAPLQVGGNTLAVTAQDAAGNRRTRIIDIEQTARAGLSLLRIGGLHQRATVGEALPAPLVVAARDAYGEPLPGVRLTFEVAAGEGALDAFPAQGSTVTAVTDAAGLARVGFTLGPRAGHGANIVRVHGGEGGPAVGEVSFAPEALPGPAARVVVSEGQRQRVTAGDDLRFALRVSDGFGNPVADAPVAVEAIEGADFDGVVPSGADGRLRLRVPTVVPGPVALRATVGDAQVPLLATAEAVADGPTRIAGRLVDEGDTPLAGSTVFALVADGPALVAVSGADGRFAIDVPPGAVTVGIEAPGRFTERRRVLVRPGVTVDMGPCTLPALDAVTGDPATLPTLAGAALSCAGDCAERWGPVRASSWPPPDGAVPETTTALVGDGLVGAALCLPALEAAPGAVRDVLARADGRWTRLGTATAVDDPAEGLRLCTDDGMGPTGGAIYGLATVAPAPSCPADCDDGDPCTAGRCEDGRCVQRPLDGPACGDDCRVAACVAGVCVTERAAADGTRCDDGDACTADEVCRGGACVGAPVVCPAADGCAVATCDPGVGCLALPRADGATCADDPCGQCRGGACVAIECPAPESECLAAACGPDGCAVEAVADGTPCGDGRCGLHACRGGACEAVDGAPGACDDGDPCTANDRCAAGRCVGRGPEGATPVAADAALFARPITALTDRVDLLLARHPPFVAAFGEALRFDASATRGPCCVDGDVDDAGGLDARARWRRQARLAGPLDGLSREVELAGPGARVTVALAVEGALDLTLAGGVAVADDACAEATCARVDARLATAGSLVAAARVVGCVAATPGACEGLTAAAGPLRPAISGQCALVQGACDGPAPPPCTVTVGPLPVAVTLTGPAGRATVPVSLYR